MKKFTNYAMSDTKEKVLKLECAKELHGDVIQLQICSL